MVLRRKTANVRAAKARNVNYAGHGRNEDWYARAPPDAEYWQRAENKRWQGLNARVSNWSSNNDWYGLKVDPIPLTGLQRTGQTTVVCGTSRLPV